MAQKGKVTCLRLCKEEVMESGLEFEHPFMLNLFIFTRLYKPLQSNLE